MSSSVKTQSRDKTGKIFLNIRRAFCYLFLILITAISIFPFWILLVNATRPHAEILAGINLWFGQSLGNNINAMLHNDFPVYSALLNSFVVAACVTFLTTYFSSMTAYGIHAYTFKLKKFSFAFILMVLMIPAQVSAAGFLKEMGTFGLMNTFWPLILPAIAAPTTVFFMRQYMQGALPLEIVEAARIDGGNEFYNFNKIVLPILKPAMAVQAIFAFIATWNNYFMPAMIINSTEKKTVPIVIAAMRGSDYMNQNFGMVYATLAVSVFPLIIVYLFFSKFIIRGVALGSVKG